MKFLTLKSKKLICMIILLINFSKICTNDEEKPINIKVIPARTNKLTLDDLDEIKMEILHDVIPIK